MTRSAAAALVLIVAAVGCRPRPDVRVLVDDRLAGPVEQIAVLYEQRTGQHVHLAVVSRGRMAVMLVSGRDDLAFAEADQVDARPVTGGLDRDSRRDLAVRGHERYAVILRDRASGRPEARSFWRFSVDAEARDILASAGFSAP